MWTGLQTFAHASTRWHSLQISSSQMQITLVLIKQVYRSLFLLITFFKLKVRVSSHFSLILPSLLFHLHWATTISLILPSLLFHLHSATTISLILPSLLFHLHLATTISLILPPLLFHLHLATTISLILPSLLFHLHLAIKFFLLSFLPLIFYLSSATPISLILPSLLFHLHLVPPFFSILPLVLFHLHLKWYFSLLPLYPPLLYPPPQAISWRSTKQSRCFSKLLNIWKGGLNSGIL